MSDTLHIPFAADTNNEASLVEYFVLQCKACLRFSAWKECGSKEPYEWFEVHKDHTGHTLFYRYTMVREIGQVSPGFPVTQKRVIRKRSLKTGTRLERSAGPK